MNLDTFVKIWQQTILGGSSGGLTNREKQGIGG